MCKSLILLLAVFLLYSFIHQNFNPKTPVVQELSLPPEVLSASNVPSQDDALQFECLAKTIYFEAGNQTETGKLLVGLTVMERSMDLRFPQTICGVVEDRKAFSWFSDGKSDRAPRNKTSIEASVWEDSKEIASNLMTMPEPELRALIDTFGGITHYHSTKVRPYWTKNKHYQFVMQEDDHRFYRWM